MRFLSMLFLLGGLLIGGPAWAGDKCSCDHQCQETCKKGTDSQCKCDCGCKEGKKCSHGVCSEH